MAMYDYYMNKIPDYYPTMYQDGYTPEQIWNSFHKTMYAEIEERNNPEPPTKIHITTEIKKK